MGRCNYRGGDLSIDPTLAGVLIAGLAGVLSWLVTDRATSIARIQSDVTRDQTHLALEQTRLSAGAQVAEWIGEFRRWASEAIDVLSESAYECLPTQMETEAREAGIRKCRHRISALIERGRLFVPNVPADGVGAHKPLAYRGYRHRILDPLVAADRILSGLADTSQFSDKRAALIHTRREFVSRVQTVIQPRVELERVASLIARAHDEGQTDQTMRGLLPAEHTIPEGAEAVLDSASQSESNQMPSLPSGRVTGQELARRWKVTVRHALYHRDGTWYNNLEQFPGALFDPRGYVIFKTREDYEKSPFLHRGIELNVPGGISSLPGYVRAPIGLPGQ
jgi:hypothetical protein